MNSGATDRQMVREYLLGRLDAEEEIESKVSDDIFLNEGLSELVDSIEHEIMEGYVEGTLDTADRQAVEERFLRPPARRAELQFQRLLRRHFETKRLEVAGSRADSISTSVRDASRGEGRRWLPLSWGTRVLVYGQAAVLLVVCTLGFAYLSRMHDKQGVLEADLAQQRLRSSSLAGQLSPNAINLLLATRRGRELHGHRPPLAIKPSTEQVFVSVVLDSSIRGIFDVRLESGGTAVWSAASLPVVFTDGYPQITFYLPAHALKSGFSSVVISPVGSASGRPEYYDFDVSVVQ